MKINITIEIDDKELKGLLFGEEKPKEKTEIEHEWDIYYDNRIWAENVYDLVLELANEHGKLSIDKYKKFLNESVPLADELRRYPKDVLMGWLLEDVQKARIARYRKGYKLVLPEPGYIN